MRTVQHCQIRWTIELRGAATSTRAEYANHGVINNGPKTHHLMETPIRDEDFPRRRHHGDTMGTTQRAGGSRQLPHPRAIRGPQHCHPTVAAIRHEQEVFVGGEGQTTWIVELTGLVALGTYGALPRTLYLRGGIVNNQQINY